MAFEVRQTRAFITWLAELRDIVAQVHITNRLTRLAGGSFGDVKSLGDGLWEMRVHHGPGYRLYYVRRGKQLVLLLCGGDKGAQDRDIARAKRMIEEL